MSGTTKPKVDLENLIIKVKRVGKSFKYIYLKDVEPIKCHPIKSIQQGLDGYILTLDNGNLYRMAIPLEDSIFSNVSVSFSRIESLPNEYDAEELKNTIRSILTPVLNFEHEDTETTQFMKNEFLKLLPFENHSWISREDEIEVKNWEYCIINSPWKLTRDRVKIIVNMFVATLKHYSDDPTAPDKWTATVNTAIQSLYNLNNGKY